MVLSDVMHWDYAFILVFLGTAVPLLGRRRVQQLTRMPETSKRDRLTLYASTIGFQWMATAFILWRARAHGALASQMGLTIPNINLAIVVALSLSGLFFANQTFSLKRLALHPEEIKGVLPHLALKIFPQDPLERLAFFVVVVTVAFCEEFIYRGFVQYVFQDWSGGAVWAAIMGSAALFALAHLYQGKRGLISTLIVGLLFSWVKAWTGSLVPSIAAHFVTDIMAGYMAPPRLRAALAVVPERKDTSDFIE